MIEIRPRTSTEAELAALDQVCDRLCGFDASFSFERVDGLLCALAAGPRELPESEWVPALLGEPFERAFGDPQSQAEALAALGARLAILRHQLDPAELFDQPEYLRLEPLMASWTDEDRQRLAADTSLQPEDTAMFQDGAEWAAGFLAAVDALPDLWGEPPGDEAKAAFEQAFRQIAALLMPPESDELKAHAAEFYPHWETKGPPTREDLLVEACLSIQDLRMYWVDFAPRTETRRVEATPGRNDPCPCGSGKKYKKCHGIA
jgi:uncharacterized protein